MNRRILNLNFELKKFKFDYGKIKILNRWFKPEIRIEPNRAHLIQNETYTAPYLNDLIDMIKYNLKWFSSPKNPQANFF